MKTVTPFLMFEGKAESAMNFYMDVFPNAKIDLLLKYGANEAGKEGEVFRGAFTIHNQQILCTDSSISHAFTFTPSFSLFVECTSEAELDEVYEKLMVDGKALMPPNNYGFSKKFAWVQDQFEISWQLNCE